MLASQLFYSELVLKSFEPYMRKMIDPGPHSYLNHFPVLFSQTNCLPQELKFYEKYLVPSVHKHCFSGLLSVLSQHRLQNDDPVCDSIEPAFLKKMKQKMSIKRFYLDLESVKIKRTKVISKCVFKGIFMHRPLNMPKECYSVEKMSQNMIALRMRGKMTREEHISLLTEKQKMYNENDYKLEKYYLDSYDNFKQSQEICRQIVEVSAEIRGRIIIDKEAVKLPLDEAKPISTHLMQIESIKVPGRSPADCTLITDIDYFMEGNPYTV